MLLLAWKNIWRNKVRSIIISFAIVFGIIGGVGFSAFYFGMIKQRLELAIGNETSNIQIHHKNFFQNKEINDTIAGFSNLLKILDTTSTIKSYTYRLKTVSMINSANSNAGIMLLAVQPSLEKEVTGIYKFIKQGNYLERQKNGIIIGEKLAKKLKVKLKSKVVITMQTPSGEMLSAAFKIEGIYRTENTGYDERMVFAKYNELSKLLGYTTPVAHEIAIALHSDESNISTIAALQKTFPDLSILSWKEIMPELAMMTDSASYILYIFMIIIFLALSFGIINTMLMAVLDRVKEIGMLMAIGMNKSKIASMIMLETILLVLTGSVIGLIISAILIDIFGRVGIDLSMFATGLSDMGFSPIIYPFISLNSYFEIIILVIITAVFSSIVPIKRALKLNPAEAIRAS